MFYFKQMDCKEGFELIYPEDGIESNEPIQYFKNDPMSQNMPDFKSWPLSKDVYTVNYAYVPKIRYNILQPKRTPFKEINIDYYVSPRKIVRYMELKGYNFIFCDTFVLQTIIIAT